MGVNDENVTVSESTYDVMTVTEAAYEEIVVSAPAAQPYVMIEGLDYTHYVGSQSSWTIIHQVTYGDVMISATLIFMIILIVIIWFHRLITGGKS